MAKRYVNRKTLDLTIEPKPTGKDAAKSLTLIYGDEVETTGPESGGKIPIEYRGRRGRVATSSLDAEARLECYFLDVGQGDAALIVTPGRRRILVDGGKSPANGRVGDALLALNWLYRLDERDEALVIDLVVLSHADEDHIGGLISLIENDKIDVKRLVHSGIATFDRTADDDQLGERDTIDGEDYLIDRHSSVDELDQSELSEDYLGFVTVLGLRGVESEAVRAGDTIDVGDPAIQIEVLGPRTTTVGGNEVFKWFGNKSHTINGHSVVLRLIYDDVRILLSGDINIEGGEHLLEDAGIKAQLDAHVLKAPHHGSHEFVRELLDAVNPQITAVSSGEVPDHGHPRPSFLGAVGQASRGEEPLVAITALSAVLGAAGIQEIQSEANKLAPDTPDGRQGLRVLFQRLLPGIINVRSDGKMLFVATRVMTGYRWVTYLADPADRTQP